MAGIAGAIADAVERDLQHVGATLVAHAEHIGDGETEIVVAVHLDLAPVWVFRCRTRWVIGGRPDDPILSTTVA